MRDVQMVIMVKPLENQQFVTVEAADQCNCMTEAFSFRLTAQLTQSGT